MILMIEGFMRIVSMVFLGIVFLLAVISVILLIAFGSHVGTASGKIL